MRICADCNNIKCRCGDCYALVEKDGKWYCDVANNYCDNVVFCGEYDGMTDKHESCEYKEV